MITVDTLLLVFGVLGLIATFVGSIMIAEDDALGAFFIGAGIAWLIAVATMFILPHLTWAP